MSEQNTGRYNLNQELIGIFFHYANRDSSHFMQPYLYNEEVPTKIELRKLTVTEHHKVPYSHDPEQKLTCDGYLLKDETGRVWKNQYPRASYGQTFNEFDYHFTPERKEGETWDDLFNSGEVLDFYNLPVFYARLMRGVTELADSSDEFKQNLHKKLVDLKEKIDGQQVSYVDFV